MGQFFLSCLNNLGHAHRLVEDELSVEAAHRKLLRTLMLHLNYISFQNREYVNDLLHLISANVETNDIVASTYYDEMAMSTTTSTTHAMSTSDADEANSTTAKVSYEPFFRNIFRNGAKTKAPAA